MNEEQKKQLITIVLTLLVATIVQVAAVYGIVVPALRPAGGELVAGSTNQKITANREGNVLTFASGSQLSAAAGSTAVFSGDVQATVVRINSTPVFWATAIPTATPANTATPVVNVGSSAYFSTTNFITATAVVVNQTPVFWATALPFIVRSGTQANYTSGSSITHGFTTTPTLCIINPVQNITATYTITTTGFSSDMQTTSAAIYWMCSKAP